MAFDSKDATPELFIPPAEPAVTLVVAEVGGKRSHGTLIRRASAPDIDLQEVRAPGVVGRLDSTCRHRTRGYSPLTAAPLWWQPRSPVTGLRWTDYLSDWSECRWSASPMPSASSRGSEGLLAAASGVGDLPLRLIIAVSPSSATWVGLGETGSLVGIPAWTLDGADLPAAQTDVPWVRSEDRRP